MVDPSKYNYCVLAVKIVKIRTLLATDDIDSIWCLVCVWTKRLEIISKCILFVTMMLKTKIKVLKKSRWLESKWPTSQSRQGSGSRQERSAYTVVTTISSPSAIDSYQTTLATSTTANQNLIVFRQHTDYTQMRCLCGSLISQCIFGWFQFQSSIFSCFHNYPVLSENKIGWE